MKKINMINEKYIEKVSVDELVIKKIKQNIKEQRTTLKKICEETDLDYGYLRQVFQGNKPVISYDIIKSICNYLKVDIAMVYDGSVKYDEEKTLTF